MAMQELIIMLVFALALGYLGNRVYRSFARKQAGCAKGCGCAADARTTASSTAKATETVG